MDKIKDTIIITLTVIVVLIIINFLHVEVPLKGAGTTSLRGDLATSSVMLLPVFTVQKVAATSTDCTARVIGTGGVVVTLLFGDEKGDLLTTKPGFTQAASTTVNYDSAIYGCGLLRARSETAASSITVSEFH